MEDNLKQKLREPFDEVFNIDIPDSLSNDSNIDGLIANKSSEKVVVKQDYSKKRTVFHNKAKKTIDSLFKFYLSQDIIDKDEYIRQKAYHEKCTLGDLMNQIEIANHAVETIMDNIDAGDVQPRYFEVLSDLMKTIIELMKMKSMVLINAEESVKKIIVDRDTYNQEAIEAKKEEAPENKQGFTARGNKHLMQTIRDAINNKEVEDVNPSDE